jgi:hypothetical protein
MQIQTEKEIGGTVYVCTQLAPEKSLEILLLLTKVLTPALKAFDLKSFDGEDVEFNADGLVGAFQSVKWEDLKQIKDAMWAKCQVKNGEALKKLTDVQDALFIGKPFDQLKVLAFCVTCNYASFLDGMDLRAMLKATMAKRQAQPLTSQTGSAGPVTES